MGEISIRRGYNDEDEKADTGPFEIWCTYIRRLHYHEGVSLACQSNDGRVINTIV